jgi:hypothetical protein
LKFYKTSLEILQNVPWNSTKLPLKFYKTSLEILQNFPWNSRKLPLKLYKTSLEITGYRIKYSAVLLRLLELKIRRGRKV